MCDTVGVPGFMKTSLAWRAPSCCTRLSFGTEPALPRRRIDPRRSIRSHLRRMENARAFGVDIALDHTPRVRWCLFRGDPLRPSPFPGSVEAACMDAQTRHPSPSLLASIAPMAVVAVIERMTIQDEPGPDILTLNRAPSNASIVPITFRLDTGCRPPTDPVRQGCG